ASAPTLQDLHAVSFGDDEMAGPEIQANAITTVLRGLPLKSVPDWVDLVLVISLGLLAPLASLRLNLRGTLALAIAAAAAFLVGTQLAFQTGSVATGSWRSSARRSSRTTTPTERSPHPARCSPSACRGSTRG
ncbi:MAG TPA: hypothetical protein VG144_04280, partial [Gaiellaceae bacterium]|nr:hypothetical protein [Gaiellaceae bacterium]